MKDRPDAILRPAQARYLDRLLPPRDALLREMEALAAERGIPISDPEVGRLLGILARSRGCRRILEIGTAIGYGVLWMARGAPQARITAIDRDPALLAEARRFLARAGVLESVELLEGDAIELLPRLEGPFDLVYIDADKTRYRQFLDFSLPRLSVGGLVVADNLLWKGWIADPALAGAADDEETRALAAFNGYFMMHPQLDAIVLPLGDGLGVAAKTRALITEQGGPF